MAAPRPANHTQESENAPGGKSNAIFGLKWLAPPHISQSRVPTTPVHSRTEIFPMVVMRRESRTTRKRTNPPETALASSVESGCRYPAYRANPIEADAIESGA